MTFLKGYRTYLLGALIFIIGGLQALGFNVPHATDLITMLIGAGAWTMRAALP